jgi:hypothetical protein
MRHAKSTQRKKYCTKAHVGSAHNKMILEGYTDRQKVLAGAANCSPRATIRGLLITGVCQQ